ncbi:tRNA ligase [Opitutaceae bacterium TAV5]|nr:tRNA ligase [Opitutaceae bacterium TAV5]
MAVTTGFHVSDEVRALGVRGVFVHLAGLTNRRSDPAFEAYKADLARRLREVYDDDFVENDPVLAGFRTLHKKVGRSNKHFPAASEALVRLLRRKGIIPSINLLVDIYNCVSLETRLALGAHDVTRVEGDIALRLTDGSERFVPLGASAPEVVPAGEYGYVDGSNEILCRLDYKQVEKTRVTETTTEAFYILQGHADTSGEVLEAALARLLELTFAHCGGTTVTVWRESGSGTA